MNMDKKNFIDRLKTMFSEVENEVKEDTFVDVKTVDGVSLRVKEEEITEGVQVYVVDEEGIETPAPEGEHVIEGKTITTDAEGKVVSVVETEVEEEVEEVEEVEAKECDCVGEEGCECDKKGEYEAEMSEEVIEEVNPMEARIEALEKSLSNIAESMSAIDGLSKAVADLANSPADKEVKLSKSSDAPIKKELTSREAKLKAFSKR